MGQPAVAMERIVNMDDGSPVEEPDSPVVAPARAPRKPRPKTAAERKRKSRAQKQKMVDELISAKAELAAHTTKRPVWIVNLFMTVMLGSLMPVFSVGFMVMAAGLAVDGNNAWQWVAVPSALGMLVSIRHVATSVRSFSRCSWSEAIMTAVAFDAGLAALEYVHQYASQYEPPGGARFWVKLIGVALAIMNVYAIWYVSAKSRNEQELRAFDQRMRKLKA